MDINKLYKHNYTPYSQEANLAIVHSKEGHYFAGCRVENISYPLSIGAAQSALFICLSETEKPETLYISDPKREVIHFWEMEFDVAVKPLDNNTLQKQDLVNVILEKDINIEETLDKLLDDAVVNESNFPVAAILETDLGYFSGVNIECSAWNMGLCAERVAIAKALAYGSTKLKKLHIHTRDGEFSSPCGACRQVIKEHMPNRQVHLHHADHSESIHFSEDLLPYSFSSTALSNK